MPQFEIVLLGAGQLGSRHLQGLAKLDLKADIWVVDPHEDSLETALERYNEVSPMVRAQFFTSLDKTQLTDADLAIVATNADIRPAALDELLQKVSVRNLVLEKVAFQSVDIFKKQIKKLDDRNIKTWVNCPRRLYPLYLQLKSELKGVKDLNMEISGNDWGMGCSTIHFVDLFAFLTSDPDVSVTGHSLDKKLHKSKRPGFYELTGAIEFGNSRGKLRVVSEDKEGISLQITIITPDVKIVINELAREYYSTTPDADSVRSSFTVPYQSGLTTEMAKDVLLKGKCGLTEVHESLKHHEIILPVYTNHFAHLLGRELDFCPIT